MTHRTLLDGTQVPELERPKTLTVYTRCPEKWILVDRETGARYNGYSTDGNLSWRKLENDNDI